MKKILGLAVGVLLSFAASAQSGVTFTDASANYDKATTQKFNFSFPSTIYTLDQINSSATFYTSYFTVSPVQSADAINVEIKLVEDTEMARRVVGRFFTTLEVKDILVNGSYVVLADFVSNYIML
jgi:hypothetical protein